MSTPTIIDNEVKNGELGETLAVFADQLSRFNPAQTATSGGTETHLRTLKELVAAIVPHLPACLHKQYTMLVNKDIFAPGIHISTSGKKLVNAMSVIHTTGVLLDSKQTTELMKRLALYHFNPTAIKELSQ